MGHYRTGSSIVQSASSALVTGPALTVSHPSNNLNLIFSGTNPTQWWFDSSTDGITWTVGRLKISGSLRTTAAPAPFQWRAYGVGSVGNQITTYSNIVTN
jgi:hypothetical protein